MKDEAASTAPLPRPADEGRVAERRRDVVLAVGAHPDDIELGCAATLCAHVQAGDRVVFLVLTDGALGPGPGCSVRRAEQIEAARRAGAELYWGGLPDGGITDGSASVAVVERTIREIGATVVYTHAPEDAHQDHRNTSRAVESAARDVSRLLFFESPTTLRFQPSLFVDAEQHAAAKLHVLSAHGSQVAGSNRVNLETVCARMRMRGFEARVRHAEAFQARRFLFEVARPASEQSASGGDGILLKVPRSRRSGLGAGDVRRADASRPAR